MFWRLEDSYSCCLKSVILVQTLNICHVINSLYSENFNTILGQHEQMFAPINAAPVSEHKWDLSKTKGA